MSSSDRAPAAEREAEAWLLGLELFGMRFGLDRMRRLLTTLGTPQERYGAVHVVGSNGKSSTVRMIAAILGAHGAKPGSGHGLRTGAYLSPHLVSFAERVRVDGHDVSDRAFAAAIARTRVAAEKVDRTLEAGDRVTQFEALTAAALDEFARSAVDVAVVEAGLGGRWDATNVLGAKVAVLTNVGLEHTRWLGPTVRDIAREKLAVVAPGSTLVVGAGLHPDALDEARKVDATLIVAPADPQIELLARGGFQRRNFALAAEAARAYLGELDPVKVAAAAATTVVPGRFQEIGADPPTFVDGAHNPGGMAALADALRDELAGRPLTVVVSILDDKDAGEMLRELVEIAGRIVLTANANPRALSPATLQSLARQLGARDTEVFADPHAALARARRAALEEDGVVLATGSIYLIADLLRGPGGHRSHPPSRL